MPLVSRRPPLWVLESYNVASAEGGTEGVQPLIHLLSTGQGQSGRKERGCGCRCLQRLQQTCNTLEIALMQSICVGAGALQ